MNVAPSVVTAYYPALRVFTYNVTGLNDEGEPVHREARRASPKASAHSEADYDEEDEDETDDGELRDFRSEIDSHGADSTRNIGIEYVFSLALPRVGTVLTRRVID